MDIANMLKTFQGPHSVLKDVPQGKKDGMFYMIDTTDYNKRCGNGFVVHGRQHLVQTLHSYIAMNGSP